MEAARVQEGTQTGAARRQERPRGNQEGTTRRSQEGARGTLAPAMHGLSARIAVHLIHGLSDAVSLLHAFYDAFAIGLRLAFKSMYIAGGCFYTPRYISDTHLKWSTRKTAVPQRGLCRLLGLSARNCFYDHYLLCL